MKQSHEILKKYWGFDSFRPLQEEIVDAVTYGNDVLALLPTGGGKSVCFQVPGLIREGVCIVVTPLISLMQDQVNQLLKKGIRAKAITSGMSYKEIDIILDNARFGGLEFLYVSPERIQTRLFQERFKLMQVGLIVVDEAHCISEWGHDFRPPYRQIATLRAIHKQVPIIALTATATQKVKEDIVVQLQLNKPKEFVAEFSRRNLSYEVYEVENKHQTIVKTIEKFSGFSGIIYCQKRRSVKELAQFLMSYGFQVGIYHGGMDKKSREEMLNNWMNNHIRIMIATNAFGMGIDKPDVRFVLHYEFPNNLEAYFQEAGRAGRDGLEARTIIYYEKRDLIDQENQIQKAFPPIENLKLTYRALCNHLKIAIGSGDTESYALNITTFSSQFKLDLFETYKALKLLELNGDLLFSENFFKPTKVKFAVGNTTLYSFQVRHELSSNLISLLTRSYSGLFDQFTEINEFEISKKLNLNQQEVIKQLTFLEKNGILDIDWKSDLPFVTFLHERLPDDYLSINPEVYAFRKNTLEKRWLAMKNFLGTTKCRAQFIIAYFGQESPKCGKCDNCKHDSQANYSFEEIVQYILNELNQPIRIEELKNKLESIKAKDLDKALQWLILEEKIEVNEGVLHLKD